jgi:NAD(P)-dependent dehydrogenase (short-subunit alcohol dehydrogenase family)
MSIEFAGRVAVVTGSSKGIGRATATLLARAGAQVVVNARHADALVDVVRFVVDAAVERDAGTWMLPESSLVYGSDAPFSGAGPGVLAGSDEELRARIVGTNALDTFQRLQAPAAIAA